jgi:hypothetical protein
LVLVLVLAVEVVAGTKLDADSAASSASTRERANVCANPETGAEVLAEAVGARVDA